MIQMKKWKWFERREWKTENCLSERNSSAETDLLTTRLSLCLKKIHLVDDSPSAHTHILSLLLDLIAPLSPLFSLSDYSQLFQASRVETHRLIALPEMSLSLVCVGKNTDHWPGRLNELLLYIDTFYFISFFFGPHSHTSLSSETNTPCTSVGSE